MPPKVLTTAPVTDDASADAALTKLPPLPDNVLVVVRNLQSQVAALTARVTALETP